MDATDRRIETIKALIRPLPPQAQCLLFSIDITGFHSVNHIYGFEAGDHVLQALQEALAQAPGLLLEEHLYGDTFLVLLRLGRDVSAEEVIASYERHAAAFLAEQKKSYPACKLNLACGLCPVTAETVAEAFSGANFARKQSKKRGFPVLYSPAMQDETAMKYEQETSLNLALHEERFCFYLQPQVDLATGAIVSAEALARRIGDDGAIIPPDKFLPLMEATGAVLELDLLIFRQVCEFLADRLAKNLPVVRTAVNLSRLHTQAPQVADQLHAIAQASRVPPQLLEFELTETIFLDEFSGAKQLIDRLRAYGYRVAIDDFGSGYAGINLWQDLTFDVIKLDRRFLSDDPELKRRNEALVPNLINIGHRLHTQVLCEGVETAPQCEYLMRLGCAVVQGYFFSPPVPPETFYEQYGRLDGRFPLPFSAQEGTPAGAAPAIPPVKKRLFSHRYFYVAVITLCALLLFSGTAAVNAYYQTVTQKQFSAMAMENLSAYTSAQREKTLGKLENTVETLQAFARLIAQREEQEFIDTYLLALNEESSDTSFLYTDAQYFDQAAAAGTGSPSDLAIVERLRRGETIVSEVTYSQRMGGRYCFAVGVPVFEDGVFSGALRGILDASQLVAADVYPPAQGEIIASFLVGKDGQVIHVAQEPSPWPDDLPGYLEEADVPAQAVTEIREALQSAGPVTCTVSLGNYGGAPIFLSLTDLGYNEWHLGVCLRADAAAAYSADIVRSVTLGTLLLLVVIGLVYAILFRFIGSLQNKFHAEEQRYLLLEQFSDTVLFDYDVRNDRIRFTSNAAKLFRCHGLVQRDFVRRLSRSYIFAGDLATIRRALRGETEPVPEEFRVRMLHPQEDHYFWCLVQCQYIREKGVIVSVVGKILNIDEQKRREDFLRELSQSDSLTGLRNKAAAEAAVQAQLRQSKAGMLLLLDIDDFKQLNDTLGHPAGDAALCYTAQCLRQNFRSSDILGRIGGDEFLVFADGVLDRALMVQKLEQLLARLAEYGENGVTGLSASIGAACYPADGAGYEALLCAADGAMYAAKQKGKRQYAFYEKTP